MILCCISFALFTDDGKDDKIKSNEDQVANEQLAKEVESIIAAGSNKTFTSMNCRSIRVGSYKSMPKEKVNITEKAIQIRVPAIANGERYKNCTLEYPQPPNFALQ